MSSLRRALVAAAVVLPVLSGCGFLDAMAHPEEQERSTAESPTTVPTPAATPTPEPGPVVVADVVVDGAGSLTVSVGPVVTGLVLPFSEFFEDCPVHGPSLQYVPVEFALPDGLAGHLTVTPGPATPADIGDVGVFFEPSIGEDAYCQGYPPLPTTDTFWAHGSGGRITGYVVLDQAVTPATPQGRADVFPTLQARIDTLRLKDPDTGVERPLDLGAVRVGALCPDDASALCVPLG